MSIVWGLTALACQPPAPAQPAPPPEPEPSSSAIPWAEGATPHDSTREVAKQPPSMDDPMAVKESPSSVGVAVSESSGRCTGKASVPLTAEVQARAAELKSCREHAPAGISTSGTLKYTLRIEADGRVETIALLEDSLQLPEVQNCFEAALKQSFQEVPRGGCVQFVLPVDFEFGATEASVPPDPS